ncbi:MAG TPA: tRNA pseudouridine(38-40) synthase TruA [Polyangiaceae bacterium]
MSEPTRKGVLLKVAYDGTRFRGWATQKGQRTVQETLDDAIKILDPGASPVRGASRTDAGVHAEGQAVAFDPSLPLQPRGWVLAINMHLPEDLCVRSARDIHFNYNPRYGSKKKRYRYRILLDRVRDPLLHFRAWRIGWPVDVEKMKREAKAIVGTHDFGAFRSAHDPRVVTTRTITHAEIEIESPRVVAFVIEGNAFLYNMVRILVGTLVDVGRDKIPEGAIARALANPLTKEGRLLAGQTAPAHGLTLESIEHDLLPDAGVAWPP